MDIDCCYSLFWLVGHGQAYAFRKIRHHVTVHRNRVTVPLEVSEVFCCVKMFYIHEVLPDSFSMSTFSCRFDRIGLNYDVVVCVFP